jgi:fructokinase
MRVWSIGEVLWDLFPDEERFGGAPLNFCANLHRLGDTATLHSAVGNDERGRLALREMRSLGLETNHIRAVDDLPTGTAIIFTDADGEPDYNIPRPAAYDRVCTDPLLLKEALASGIDWVYFGTLLQTAETMERFTSGLVQELHLQGTRVFYDMNLRKGQWTLDLVQRLSAHASVLKLNETEAETLFHLTQQRDQPFSLEAFCQAWASTYGIHVICVTLGAAGCFIYDRGLITRMPGYQVTVCDTVGSGDAFAAAFLHGYHRRWPIETTARFANALGALVASRAGATPQWTLEEIVALVGRSEPDAHQTSDRR